MRIRKRFPPSSLSSVSLPSSDPQLARSPPLMQHHQLQSASTDSQPSDPRNQPHHPHLSNQAVMIGSEKPIWVHEQKELDGEEVVKDERCGEEEKNNVIIRKSKILGQDSSTQILPPYASRQVVERWVDGDKVIPLKKRIMRDETKTAEKDEKMKSKTNKKCIAPNSEEQEEGSERSKSKSSNNKRGSEIMEGSRCSRVNGRGWRCGQQTLVGYSLCEHHLGKGRLRSMTSVRSRAVANTRVAPHKPELEPESEPEPKPEPEQLLDYDDDDYDDDDEEDSEAILMGSKKRMRHGVVKARSIRSLLGQTDSGVLVVVADDNKNRS